MKINFYDGLTYSLYLLQPGETFRLGDNNYMVLDGGSEQGTFYKFCVNLADGKPINLRNTEAVYKTEIIAEAKKV